jgi:peptidoglycan/LPS O-acetylase OafA/YrhL
VSRRFEELDSMRGLAALSVLLSHLVLSFGLMENSNYIWVKIMKETPLSIIYAGHEAVIFFFLLSGFVLALPFLKGRKINYFNYITRRALRLYLPVIFSIFVIVLIRLFLVTEENSEVGEWLNGVWAFSLNYKNVLQHLLLIGSFDYNTLNPVIWTLVHEMRISIIFPFIILFVLKYNWKWSVCIGIILSCIGGVSHLLFSEGHISYPKTLHYTFIFIVGSILAKHLTNILDFLNNKGKKFNIISILLGILMYTYSFWFIPNNHLIHNTLLNDWATTIGAGILLISALNYKPFSYFLNLKPILFIGKISYSLYLFHLIAILSVFNMFAGKFPNIVLGILSIILTLVFSVISYYLIELPSIKLGKKIKNETNDNFFWKRAI